MPVVFEREESIFSAGVVPADAFSCSEGGHDAAFDGISIVKPTTSKKKTTSKTV